MNFNSTGKKSNFEVRDSINSIKNNNITDTQNKSLKKDEDNFFAVNISKTSQEMRNNYYENSEIKSKTIKNNNDNESSNNNTFNLSNKKYTFSSQKSNHEIASKQIVKTYNTPNQENISQINNDNFSKKFLNNKVFYPSELITNYKFWTGANYFPFKAQIIEGPQNFKPTLMTGTAITIGIILFLIFESEYLNDEITIFIPILFSLLYIAILFNLITASFIDPGIIRRFDLKDFNNIKQRKEKQERIVSRIFQLGNIMSYKYCYTCGIMRPNRSTHCSECNNCVERLDHHCPWMGNCTGKRNYIYFFIFLTLLNILQILVIIFCLIHIIQQIRDDSNLNDKLPLDKKKEHLTSFSFCEVIMSLYLIIYNIFFMFFTMPLIVYHINLILTNVTTKEKIRDAFYHGNPFIRNKIQNIKNVLSPEIKKHNILEILRGDFKEICDTNYPNDKGYKKNYDHLYTDENNQNQEINETQDKLNLKLLKNGNVDELNFEKNNEQPNLNISNISETKNQSQKNNFYTKNNIDIFQEKNNDINSIKEPEPLDTTIGHSDDKGKEIKNYFLSNSSPQIREFVKNFGKRKIIDD